MTHRLTLLVIALAAFLFTPSIHAQSDDAELPTLYIIGDSTVKHGKPPGRGWGEVIDRYFDTTKLHVVNRAIGGRSTRTFLREGRWDAVRDALWPGDFVIMQFGHNDGGTVGDPRFKRRPALPGVGDETQDVTIDDTGTIETVHTYGWYLRRFCREAAERGATAIVCSPIPHKDNWRDGTFTPDFEGHRAWAAEAAAAEHAAFINLTLIIGRVYQEMGPEAIDPLFDDARTHTNEAGALVNARCVLAGLKALPGETFAGVFSAAAAEIEPADSALVSGINAPATR